MTIQLTSFHAGQLLLAAREKFVFKEPPQIATIRFICQSTIQNMSRFGFAFCPKGDYYYPPYSIHPKTLQNLCIAEWGFGSYEERVTYLFKKCFESGIEAYQLHIRDPKEQKNLSLLILGNSLNLSKKNWLSDLLKANVEIIDPCAFLVIPTSDPSVKKLANYTECLQIDHTAPTRANRSLICKKIKDLTQKISKQVLVHWILNDPSY